MKKIDVLCVGATSYDFVFGVKHHPLADEKTTSDIFVSCGGGPAANAAVAVAKLGLTSAFCGYLGKDVFGQLHLQEMQAAGVHTDFIILGDRPTPISTVLVKPDGKRTVVNHRANKEYISPKSIDISHLNPKVLLFDGHEPEVTLSLLQYAQRNKIPAILDAGSVHEGTSALYDKADYLICSQKFSREITGETDPESALKKLFNHNKNVIITLGKEGLIWKTEAGSGSLPAYSVNVVDTTGAGDVFHGAFACCLARGKEWKYALQYSSAAAAISCSKLGARIGIPDKNEVDKYLASM